MFRAGRPSPPPAAAALYAQPSKVPSAPAAAALYAQPSDVTLVEEFLRPWVTSGEVPTGTDTPVHTVDLYSADPEELARRFQPAVSLDGGGDRTWYFLSPLRNRSPRDRRKVRAVAGGAGCWHSEAGPKNVVDYLDGHRHVGYRQSFSFMRRSDAGTDSRTGWIMAEFHLHRSHEKDGGRGWKVEGLVLCKMYRSPRNRGPAASPDGDDDDDDVGSSISMSADTTFSCGKSKAAAGDEDSNADMPRQELCSKNSAAGDDEVSGTTTAAVPCPKNKTVVVNDDDFVASPPTHKKMRVTVVDTESSGAALVLKTTAAGAPNAAGQLHCPQCGFHLATLQPLVTETIEQ